MIYLYKYNRMRFKMKISVIIPVYNTKDYLYKCLDSVLNQSLDEMEILVIDDGSTDGSSDILKEYAQKYPEKIVALFKENGGQASARNLALKIAKGEYLGFVDSDDWIDPDMYETMYNTAKADHADIVICDTVDHYPTHDVYHHASQFDDKFKVTPSACNKIFKREFIGEINFPEGLWYEDFEFTTKSLMLTDNISVIHTGFYHCHCRETSTMTNNNSEKNLDMLSVFDHLIAFVEEHSLTEKYRDTLEYLHIDHILISTINRLEQQKNKKKNAVIAAMRATVKKRYPKFYKGKIFKSMPRNRKIVAFLNYVGLSKVSKILLNIKNGQK